MTRTRKGKRASAAGVVADTHLWVEYFSQKNNNAVAEIDRLLRQDLVRMVEPVRYELLTGARATGEREYLVGVLRALPMLETSDAVWVEAIRLSVEENTHLNRVPMSDVLIAATCRLHGCSLMTRDPHFDVFTELLRHPCRD